MLTKKDKWLDFLSLLWLMGDMNNLEKLKLLGSRVEIIVCGHRLVIHALPARLRQRILSWWVKRR